jgi:hypothetical protein
VDQNIIYLEIGIAASPLSNVNKIERPCNIYWKIEKNRRLFPFIMKRGKKDKLGRHAILTPLYINFEHYCYSGPE